jgi:hypothetical protein
VRKMPVQLIKETRYDDEVMKEDTDAAIGGAINNRNINGMILLVGVCNVRLVLFCQEI